MKYKNPVILADYSDPDVIRVDEDFFMVASSFNNVPCVPVLHSKNLVEWKLINYVFDEIPFERFNEVCHGDGAWAPSLRYKDGKFYCLIPFPDEGIFVSETENPFKEWSPLRPLLIGKGFEDPCPIWIDNKAYVVFAFAKSRAGFNSKLAIFEADEYLTKALTNYTVIYDGHNIAPKIEGPKLLKRNKFYYIFAPCGGVENGWQVALRSSNIYGPYETKIILAQGDTKINGPHQGAAVDLDDEGSKWAFLHFQDMGAYGRVVHLQPMRWIDEWPVAGEVTDEKLFGTPVLGGEYPVDIKTDFKIDPSDEFDGNKLSLVWQTPANRKSEWFSLNRGLKLNCVKYDDKRLYNMPQLFMQKVNYLNFSVNCKCKLNLLCDGDETGLVVFGKEYAYVCAVRRGGQNFLEIRKGAQNEEKDETLALSRPYDEKYITFKISAKYEERNRLTFKFTFGKTAFTRKFYASKGVWTGARIGLYAKGCENSAGYALYKYFKVLCTDNRVSSDGNLFNEE